MCSFAAFYGEPNKVETNNGSCKLRLLKLGEESRDRRNHDSQRQDRILCIFLKAIFSTFWGDFHTRLHRKPGENEKNPLEKTQRHPEETAPRNCIPSCGRTCPENLQGLISWAWLGKFCRTFWVLFRSRPGKPNQRKGQNEKFLNFAHFCEFW